MLTADGVEDASIAMYENVKTLNLNSCLDKKERCLNFRQPDEVFKILHVRQSDFVYVELIQIEKKTLYCAMFCSITKILVNTVLNSATARQYRNTIFQILRVRQYRISSILSQSLHDIRFIECYFVPDHQEVVKYM